MEEILMMTAVFLRVMWKMVLNFSLAFAIGVPIWLWIRKGMIKRERAMAKRLCRVTHNYYRLKG